MKVKKMIIVSRFLVSLAVCVAVSSIIYISYLQDNEPPQTKQNPNVKYLEDPELVNYDTINRVYESK